MPRPISRIRPLDNTVQHMDAVALSNCFYGHCWGFADWPDIRSYEDAWRRWGDLMARQYPKCYPASRPVIQYYLGLVPAPPAALLVTPATMVTRHIPGMKAEIRHTGWHMQQTEADWLLEAGVINKTEHRLGLKRLADPAESSIHVWHKNAGE